MGNYFLAVDIGASSGRHILGSIQDGRIVIEEVYRFENGMAKKDGHLQWDVNHLAKDCSWDVQVQRGREDSRYDGD